MPSLNHKTEVEVLSSAEGKQRRETARAAFIAAATAAGPSSPEAQILEMEKQSRGGDAHEPETLPCRGLAAALLRAAQAGN